MSRRFLLVCLLSPLAIALGVFVVAGLAGGMLPGETWRALAEQSVQRKQNPLLSGVLGFFPILLLLLALRIGRRFDRSGAWSQVAPWAGLLPILLVLLWANLEFWPKFLPSRVYPGFPHGLELLIGPVMYAPVGMIVGLIAARFVPRA
ncbi:MAG: hypothetical protein DHS20C21_15760 [Gemmatimonadota bacterium]|nr:MAG: hypothetical protein DHS20C21_15760 [Gemmatimonadota bacterium]